jgi:hypothetical protein
MARYTETTGNLKRVTITPAITRAYWSKSRAFQGDKVRLYVETDKVPDGTEVTIHIREDGADTGDADSFVDEVKGPHRVKDNRLSVEYTVDWDPETLGRTVELEGERFEFYFVVATEALGGLSQRSTLLYVDLHDLSLSS